MEVWLLWFFVLRRCLEVAGPPVLVALVVVELVSDQQLAEEEEKEVVVVEAAAMEDVLVALEVELEGLVEVLAVPVGLCPLRRRLHCQRFDAKLWLGCLRGIRPREMTNRRSFPGHEYLLLRRHHLLRPWVQHISLTCPLSLFGRIDGSNYYVAVFHKLLH